MQAFLVFVSLAFFFLCFKDTEAVSKCYFCVNPCDTAQDPDCVSCDNPKELNCIDLGPGDFLCSIIVIGGVETRSCAHNTKITTDMCDTMNKQDGTSCELCDTDLCNSAAHYSVSVVVMGVLFFFITKFV